MRKTLIIFFFFLVIFVIGCDRINPVDNPQPELFSVLHEGEDFTLFIRTYIDPNALYYSYAVNLVTPDGEVCVIGDYEMQNYLVEYDNQYYNILGGYQLELFTTEELIEWGLNVGCPID